jgi:hypothetical protein
MIGVKRFSPFLGVAVCLICMLSCSSGAQKETLADKKLGKIKLEIPESLSNKPEIVEYLQGMNQVIDDYVIIIDETAEKAKPFRGKDFEKLGLVDKAKITKITTEATYKSMEVLARWAEMQDKRLSLEQNLSEDEVQALNTVFDRFQKRMEQIEVKYKDVFANEKEEETVD